MDIRLIRHLLHGSTNQPALPPKTMTVRLQPFKRAAKRRRVEDSDNEHSDDASINEQESEVELACLDLNLPLPTLTLSSPINDPIDPTHQTETHEDQVGETHNPCFSPPRSLILSSFIPPTTVYEPTGLGTSNTQHTKDPIGETQETQQIPITAASPPTQANMDELKKFIQDQFKPLTASMEALHMQLATLQRQNVVLRGCMCQHTQRSHDQFNFTIQYIH
ncbi:uncharacterized protein LOC120071919 [Benincasa hispida]|uniref:uncharacterized protein LOC120071919 n=1 Tax=Benincasa hispida TaxID=102211 RepID=UPI0018FFB612|nr:uncharacterized protein LOC120071919 [Benincasa hispida]XP_038880273.1 uncharacterized protein LOC120071919 [Benincasa hispida]